MRAHHIVFVTAVVAGCNGNSDSYSAAAADMTAQPDLTTGSIGYPAGPYGGAVGDVVDDFTLQGYYSPTMTTGVASSQPFGAITFDQIRTSGAKYALLELAAFW